MIAKCVDKDRITVNKLHVTIKYTCYLAVRNVKRQIVSHFVKRVKMFQSRYYQS